MEINAKKLHFSELNRALKQSPEQQVVIRECLGHRYIACGVAGKEIEIFGVPGNALGAYLNGSTIKVNGNTQDATGDTMNEGEIIIHGNSGDATGYAMRGGRILIKGNAGYRAGIHMKEYQQHKPVIVVGNRCGDFLGEYQAGGLIVVLGLESEGVPVGNFCGTGMHGGKIVLRSNHLPGDLPKQVRQHEATPEDMAEIAPHIADFCRHFGYNKDKVLDSRFFVLTPNTANPYKQLYTYN